MPGSKMQPIIVIKKKGGHGGHHGGAWKVAYADFVTAMMSLFIVLWLMSSNEKVKKAVAGYFQDPSGTSTLMGTTLTGTGQTVSAASADNMQKLKDKLEQEIAAKKDLQKLSKQIEITVTPEGLRIELIEDKNGTFYESGSARLSDKGQELLVLLATELRTLPNNLLIEGYTDAAKYSKGADYGNWELSADRANSARRLMQEDGVRENQVTQVRAYADQLLRVNNNPYDPSNRRISILVKNQEVPIPDMKSWQTVNGPPPLASSAPNLAAGAAKPTESAEDKKPTTHESAQSPAAPAKPSAAAAPKEPGLLVKLKSLLPGKQ